MNKGRTLFCGMMLVVVLFLCGCMNQEESAEKEGIPAPEEEIIENPCPACGAALQEEMPLGKDESGYHYAQKCTSCSYEKRWQYDALLTFVDDDGKMQAMLHWERIIDATGIEMTAALIPEKIGEMTDYDKWWSYAGWDLLDRMGQKGMDFVHHTYSHKNLTKLSETEIREDLKKSQDALKRRGIDSRILVCPNNASNDTVRAAARDYFDVAVICGNQINVESFHRNYGLHRMNSNDAERMKTIRFDAERIVECQTIKSEEKLEQELTMAIDSRGWLIYMTHAYDSPAGAFYFDEEAEETLIHFCQYAMSGGNVRIVSLTEGVAASAPLVDAN